MEREAFLARLRERLAVPAPDSLPHPMRKFTDVPPVTYTRDLSDPVLTFIESASRVGATARRVDDVDSFVEEVLRSHPSQTMVTSRDPEVAEIAERFRSAGVGMAERDGDLGITGAAWGIAATGSVVVCADRAGGRTASLLPEVHVALVRASNILPDPAAIYRAMSERFPAGPPSQFVFVTGPSRSADIELTLTVGVHGPRHVWVGILP